MKQEASFPSKLAFAHFCGAPGNVRLAWSHAPCKIPRPRMANDTEFSIPISDLDAAGKPYEFPVRAAWLRGVLEGHEATPVGEDGHLAVRLSKSGTDVVVHGSLTASLTMPCARCLEPVAIAVKQPITALLVPRSKLRQEGMDEYEFSAADADMLPYDGETVVLDDLVRDELLLETPMIPLCSEDCPGMTPSPQVQAPEDGAETRIDPRLLPLLQLKNRGNS